MSRRVVARGLRYAQHGPPSRVLKKEEWSVPFDASSTDVVVKMVAAPVHPRDRAAIFGQAGASVAGPVVAGSEGVGIVQEAGSACKSRQKGDYVVFNSQDVGTWADHVVVSETQVDRVPEDLQPEDLSLMGVYGTAWQLVNSFGKVKPDDVCWVLGDGAIATATACLLQQKGATVVIVLRTGHPNDVDLQDNYRVHLPNSTTLRTSHLSDKVMLKVATDLKPKFIFNGLGGQALRESVRFAQDSCKVVTFGNQSKEPLQLSVGRHIFQDVQLLPFSYSHFLSTSTQQQREEMYEKIGDMLRSGAHGNRKGSEHQWRPKLYVRAERYAFEEHHKEAVNNAGLLFSSRKPILRFGEEYEWTHSGEWHKDYELLLPRQLQYLENIDTAVSERRVSEYESLEYGGPLLQAEFNNLWDTDAAKEVRKGMKQLTMRQDQFEVIADTYERYLELQAEKYGIAFSPQTPKTSPLKVPGTGPLETGAFFPDDDPTYAAMFKKQSA